MKITKKDMGYGEQTTVIRDDSELLVAKLTSEHKSENKAFEIALALLYSELLLSGTKRKGKEEISNTLDLIGGSISVSYVDNSPTYNLCVLAKNQKAFLSLLKEIWSETNFSDLERKKRIKSLSATLTLQLDDAKARAESNLRNSLYHDDSIYHVESPQSVIKALLLVTRGQISDFHKKIQANKYFVTVGGSEKSVKIFGDFLKNNTKQIAKVSEVTPEKINYIQQTKRLVSEEIPSKQNLELSFGSFLPLTLNDNDFVAFFFGLAVLGKWGGFAGRLMSTVREKEGLTYGIYARSEGAKKDRPGHWRIMTFFAPKDLKQGVTSTLREIAKIAKSGITEDEYLRFKNILKTSEVLLYDSLQRLVSTVHDQKIKGFDFSEYLDWRQKLYQVERKNINQALKKYLDPKNITLSIAGPTKKVNLKEIEALF